MTTRQAEIIELVAAGLLDKEIAATLGVAHRTVRSHLERYQVGSGRMSRTGMAVAWLLSDACTDEQRGRVRARLAAATGVVVVRRREVA